MQTLPEQPTRTQQAILPVRGPLGSGLIVADEPFEWTSVQQRAAMCFAGILLPPGKTSPQKVAEACGVSVQTVKAWRNHPDFIRKVDSLIRHTAEDIMEAGLAMKATRILELQKRHAMLTSILESREEWAAEFAPGDVVASEQAAGEFHLPGIGSGAMVVRHKSVGSGSSQVIVMEAEFDNALFLELRAIEKQIAQELGQLNPQTSVSINMKMYSSIDIGAV